MSLDITFDADFVSTIPPLVTVRDTTWRYVFVDTELWDDGYYHPIYAPYCAVSFAPNALLCFPTDLDEIDF